MKEYSTPGFTFEGTLAELPDNWKNAYINLEGYAHKPRPRTEMIGVHPEGVATLKTLLPEAPSPVPHEIKSLWGIPVMLDEGLLPHQFKVVTDNGDGSKSTTIFEIKSDE